MLCVISRVWFLGFMWIHKNAAACDMRVGGKLSKETTGTKGRRRGEKMEQERAREDVVNVDMHLHESKSLHVPRVLNIYSENSFKGTKSCLSSANSSSPYAFRDPFLPLYLCVCLSPCICLSTSASLPRSGCHVRGCRVLLSTEGLSEVFCSVATRQSSRAHGGYLWYWSTHFKLLFTCIYCACVCGFMHTLYRTSAYVWRSKDSLWELVLPSYHMVWGIKFRSPGSADFLSHPRGPGAHILARQCLCTCP